MIRLVKRGARNVLQQLGLVFRFLRRGWAASCPACGGRLKAADEGRSVENCTLCGKEFKLWIVFDIFFDFIHYIIFIISIIFALIEWYYGVLLYMGYFMFEFVAHKYLPRKEL